MDTHRGTFTSAHELLDRLRARQAEIGLSNEGLEDLAGLTAGEVNKYLGPSREKFPGLFKILCMMDALGLSGELFVDARKVEKMTNRWRRAGKRRMAAIRIENPRVSQVMVKRAVPEVARMAAQIRWDNTAPEARRAYASIAARGRWKLMSPRERAAYARRIARKRWGRRSKEA